MREGVHVRVCLCRFEGYCTQTPLTLSLTLALTLTLALALTLTLTLTLVLLVPPSHGRLFGGTGSHWGLKQKPWGSGLSWT